MACVSFRAGDDSSSAMSCRVAAGATSSSLVMMMNEGYKMPLSPKSSRVMRTQMLKTRFAPLISKAQKILDDQRSKVAAASHPMVDLHLDPKKKTLIICGKTLDDQRSKEAAASHSMVDSRLEPQKKTILCGETLDDQRTGNNKEAAYLHLVGRKKETLTGKTLDSQRRTGNISKEAVTSSSSSMVVNLDLVDCKNNTSAAAAADRRNKMQRLDIQNKKMQLQRKRVAEQRESDQMRNTTGIYDPCELVRDLEKMLGHGITYSRDTPLPSGYGLPAFIWNKAAEPQEEECFMEDNSCQNQNDNLSCGCAEAEEREEGEIWE